MKRVINEHKGLAILTLLVVVFIAVMTYVFVDLFFSGSKNKYGSRLEGINDVIVSNERLNSIEQALLENEGVASSKCRIQGKIIYIELTLDASISKDTAKEYANKTLEDFSQDELAFYDLGYFLKWEATEESSQIVITGTKHPKTQGITWTRN